MSVPLHILDTNTITLLSHGAEPLSTKVRGYAPDELGVAVITLREALDGWYALLNRAKTPEQIEAAYARMIKTFETLARFRLYNFTRFAVIRYEGLARQKLNVGGNDLRIAAIALEHRATVVSANLRDFGRVPGLPVEDWTA